MARYHPIEHCRISQSKELIPIVSLGNQDLTGVFPKTKSQEVTSGPLELVWCPQSKLLQLRHSYEPDEMYGLNYGYRSGLNQSMVEHLGQKVNWLEAHANLAAGDVVLDIGSNDCTLLKLYQTPSLNRIGIDPTGIKFKSHYPDDVTLISDFFSARNFQSNCHQQAKIITSISMFYDLEDPNDFVRDIASILHPQGIWHFEQSYMPTMLRLTSYDTICHEHLEYYSLSVVKDIVEQAGLQILSVAMNEVNGGSFALTVGHRNNHWFKPNHVVINWLLDREKMMGLDTLVPYQAFADRIYHHRDTLKDLIDRLNSDGKTVMGYGASTKGNALLQFCGFSEKDIPAIMEINEDKFNCFTPGTWIPILSEEEAMKMKPDYLLVLPWHFRAGILKRERSFLDNGGHFIFPFPEVEII